MWICMNDSFVSVVEDPLVWGNLMVRARRLKDLRNAVPKEFHGNIFEDLKRDYRFRVSISRDTFARVLFDRVRGIDYGNFKDSVSDKRLKSMYTTWWGDHLELDPHHRRAGASH